LYEVIAYPDNDPDERTGK